MYIGHFFEGYIFCEFCRFSLKTQILWPQIKDFNCKGVCQHVTGHFEVGLGTNIGKFECSFIKKNF